MGTVEIMSYEVSPDGYAESTLVDKYHWRLYVERMEQEDGTMLWRVVRHPGQSRRGYILSSAGNWIMDSPRMKQWTRHTLERALELANVACERGPNNWTLKQFEDHFRKRDEERKEA